MKRILKSFVFGLAVFFILTAALTIVHGKEVNNGCCFGMKVAGDSVISMRLQCGKDKPIDLGKCETWKADMGSGNVGMATTCCAKGGDLCMTVITHTDEIQF